MSLVDAGSGRFIYRVEAKHIGWRRKVTLYDTCNMSDDQWAHCTEFLWYSTTRTRLNKKSARRGEGLKCGKSPTGV